MDSCRLLPRASLLFGHSQTRKIRYLYQGARQRGNAVLMRRAGVPTYADGNVGSDLSAVLSRLDATLSDLKGSIPAYMNMYGTGGGAESLEIADKFLRRVGKRR